jgi:hypothetical protein
MIHLRVLKAEGKSACLKFAFQQTKFSFADTYSSAIADSTVVTAITRLAFGGPARWFAVHASALWKKCQRRASGLSILAMQRRRSLHDQGYGILILLPRTITVRARPPTIRLVSDLVPARTRQFERLPDHVERSASLKFSVGAREREATGVTQPDRGLR